MEVITKTAKQTQKLGEEFAQGLKGGEVIGLIGELGSGKTTFVQGLAKGLGIKKRIISPTFVFIRPYDADAKNAKYLRKTRKLYHVDLYRVKNSEDAGGLGLEEIWSEPNNIVVIEWAEKIKDLLPEDVVIINFEYLDKNMRLIRLWRKPFNNVTI